MQLLDRLVPLRASDDPEVLIEQGAVEALDEAIGLRPAHLRGPVLDALELQEELLGMPVGPAAELASVVAEDGPDRNPVLLEEGQHVVVRDLYRRQGHLARVETTPGMAAEAVQHGLQVDLPHALSVPTEKVSTTVKRHPLLRTRDLVRPSSPAAAAQPAARPARKAASPETRHEALPQPMKLPRKLRSSARKTSAVTPPSMLARASSGGMTMART